MKWLVIIGVFGLLFLIIFIYDNFMDHEYACEIVCVLDDGGNIETVEKCIISEKYVASSDEEAYSHAFEIFKREAETAKQNILYGNEAMITYPVGFKLIDYVEKDITLSIDMKDKHEILVETKAISDELAKLTSMKREKDRYYETYTHNDGKTKTGSYSNKNIKGIIKASIVR